MKTKKNKTARSRILEYIYRHPQGVTSGEIERRLRIAHTTTASSLNYFINQGFITIAGDKYNRKTNRWSKMYRSAIL